MYTEYNGSTSVYSYISYMFYSEFILSGTDKLCAAEYIDDISNSFFLLAFILIITAHKKGVISKKGAAVTAGASAVIIIVLTVLFRLSEYKGIWIICVGGTGLLGLCSLLKTKSDRQKVTSFLIIGLGFLEKFHYVLYTTVTERQHDVGHFGEGSGHAGYIEYILFNHKLPDFDVTTVWQFSHPPLHHTIAAVWIAVNEKMFGISPDAARESVQTLTLFYSMVIVILSYRIFRYFRLSGKALFIPLAVVSFHPAFIMFSGSINNDVLSVAFMTGAVYCTLKWYNDRKMSSILKIALCTGLGMMTKLSAALIAPPIAVVFLVVFIKNIKTSAIKLIGQYLSFAAVCAPLGLWFEIKNLILYKTPVTYVCKLEKNLTQYIGDQSYKSRITDFSLKQFDSVFEQWLNIDENGVRESYNEHNPIIAVLKNSLFGEYINEKVFINNSLIIDICTLFFYISAVIALLAFVYMIVICFRKCPMRPLIKVFFVSFYFILIANLYKMAADYPFTCTLNFRYITPTVITGMLFTGLYIQNISESKRRYAKFIRVFLSVITVAFVLMSAVIFTAVVYPVPNK